jgi:hypothetical protein
MTTEQRRTVRGALIDKGFRRYYSQGDEVKEAVVAAVMEQEWNASRGVYTELFKHHDGTVVSVSWGAKTNG